MDPSGGDLLGLEKNMGLIRREAYIRIKKSEEPLYTTALDAYCARTGKTTENLPLFMQLYNFVV